MSTGYKLREKIGKALKTCADVIRCTLKAYNTAAAQLIPPCPQLTWTKLMEATTLADFDLLQDSCQDICQQPWMHPSQCEAMNLYFGIKHAKEEIVWLNIEICCLITFMIDDHRDFYHAISANIMTDPALAWELSSQWEAHDQVHSQITSRLHQTLQLKGFTGTLLPGTQEGCDCDATAVLPHWAGGIIGLSEMHSEMDESDKLENDEDLPKEVVADPNLIVQLVESFTIQDDIDIHSSSH